MITSEQLVQCLRQANFSEDQIRSILQKRIKTLLKTGNVNNVNKILKTLKNYGIKREIISGCLTVLTKGKAEEIERIFKVLYKHGIETETIEGCLSVLARGKAEEIERIFKILDKHGIGTETIENCLSVLARGKAEEIERIFNVLDEYRIETETIEGCLTVLAKGKAEEIERIFKVLDEHGIGTETIEGCLYVLATGKAEEIERIFKVLDEHGIGTKTIEGYLSVLAIKKASDLNRVLTVLEHNNIDKKVIEQQYIGVLNSGIDVEDIFKGRRENKDDNTYFRIIRMYMRLTQMYDKYYTREQIEQFCDKKDITITEFLEKVVLYPNNERLGPVLYELLKRNRKLYIGKPIAISKDYLVKHGSEILELSKRVARKFGRVNSISDIQELESLATQIMVDTCGALVNNLSHNPNALTGSMFNYTYKVMKGMLKKQTTSLTVINKDDGTREEREVKSEDTALEDTEINVNYRNAGLTNEEKDVMQCMVSLVEQGEAYQLNQRVAEILGIESEDVEDILSKIREKMIDNKIVEINSKGGVEWREP